MMDCFPPGPICSLHMFFFPLAVALVAAVEAEATSGRFFRMDIKEKSEYPLILQQYKGTVRM